MMRSRARHSGCFELQPIEYRSGVWILHIPQSCPAQSRTLIISPGGERALLPYLATHHGSY
jgi:hypothetical protein